MVPKHFPTMWSMRSAFTAMALLIAAAPCTSIPRVLCTDAGVARSTGLIAPSRAAGTTESPGSAGLQRRAALRLRGGDSESPVRDRVNPPQKAPMKFPKEVVLLSKSTAAVFVGLLTTSAVMVAFEFTAHKVGASLPHAATDAIAALVVAGGLVGSLFGGWVLARLAPSHSMLLAALVGALFTGAQFLDRQGRAAGPSWYSAAGLVSFIPPYLAAAYLSTRAGRRVVHLKSKSSKGKTPKKSSKGSKTPGKSSKRRA